MSALDGDPIVIAEDRSSFFRDDFLPWLRDNLHIYQRFEDLALQVAERRAHYGARSLVEKMRYDMAISEPEGRFKINGNMVPCMARLFAYCNPSHAQLFEFREQQ